MAAEELTVRAHLRDELSGPARRVRGEIRGLRTEVDEVNASSAAAAGGAANFDRALGRLHGTAGPLHKRLVDLSSTLTGAFATGLKRVAIGVGALTLAAGVFGLKASSNFQQTRVAFDTMLGSVEAGGKLFSDLQGLNLKSPFELSSLTSATQILLRYGVAGRDVVGVTRGIANAAALSGPAASENLQRMALALGQVQAKGHLAGEEARQLAEAGINAYLPYMKVLGLTRDQVEKLGEQGKLTGDILLTAVAKGDVGINGLNQAAERMSLTLSGQFSNLKDLLNVGLAQASGPLADSLGRLIGTPDKPGALVAGITSLVNTAGPPIFDLLGHIATIVSRLLPSVGPVLASLVGGAGHLLDAMVPGFSALEPVIPELTAALDELVGALVPVMPELVDAFVNLVKVLPEFVRLLAALVPLVTPILTLIDGLLGVEPVRKALAGVLAVLLGYRALDAVVTVIRDLAGSFRGLAAAEETEGIARAGASGAGGLGGLGRAGMLGAAAVPLFGMAAGDAKKGHQGRSELEFVGGMTATGAAIGTLVPIPGISTLVGAGLGAAAGGIVVGAHHLGAGDTGSALRGTLAMHRSLDASVPGSRQVTNALVGSSPNSDHPAGYALDLVGSGLFGYAQTLRAAGGYAAFHGDHLHAVYGDTGSPRRSTMTGDAGGGALVHIGDGGALVHVGTVNTPMDLEAAVFAGIRRYDRERTERGGRTRA